MKKDLLLIILLCFSQCAKEEKIGEEFIEEKIIKEDFQFIEPLDSIDVSDFVDVYEEKDEEFIDKEDVLQPEGEFTYKIIGEEGDYEGFEILKDEKLLATLKLSSNKLIYAETIEEIKEGGEDILKLKNIKGKDPLSVQFSKDDFVIVHFPEKGFPRIEFKITIENFDPEKWKSPLKPAEGEEGYPFHFLSLFIPSAKVFHHRGWLMPTPLQDPFTLLQDIHVGSPEVAAKWSRNWSYAPPIGAFPIPLIGLWDYEKGIYAGFDFMDARVNDNSERYVASSYCWKEGKDGQFITLVYPYQGVGFQTLTYPKKGDKIQSHLTILISDKLFSVHSPNLLWTNYHLEKDKDFLPEVPELNNVDYLPGGAKTKDWNYLSHPSLIWSSGDKGGTFEEPNTIQIGGWRWHRDSIVAGAKFLNNIDGLKKLKDELNYLIQKVKTFNINGEVCKFWEKPIEGKWWDVWGGEPVKTLHNANGWSAGIAFIDFYRLEGIQDYLPLIDGIFNWTKNFVWTRNEFADVPSSPFAIGSTLASAFLIDYYFTFKNDPERKEKAIFSLELARNIIYNYVQVWIYDNDRWDNLDGNFLMEPNSGRDWTGEPCSNEVAWVIDSITQVYVNTGDKFLNYILKGALERWYLLYRDLYKESIDAYGHDAMTESWGLFDGVIVGRGGRANYGWAEPLPLHFPVGNSLARIICGEKGFFVTNKNGTHTDLSEYKYFPDGNFSFKIKSKLKKSFDISLTFPFLDISNKGVKMVRDGNEIQLNYYVPQNLPSSLYIYGVQDKDEIIVGEVPSDTPSIQNNNEWTYKKTSQIIKEGNFKIFLLPYDKDLNSDWYDKESFAGLPQGKHYAYGVPYYIMPYEVSDNNKNAVSNKIDGSLFSPSENLKSVFIVFSPIADDGMLTITLSNKNFQQQFNIKPEDSSVAWRGWPPIFEWKLLLAGLKIEKEWKILSILPKNALVFAITGYYGDDEYLEKINQEFIKANKEFLKELKEEELIKDFSNLVEKIPDKKIALLPPLEGGALVTKLLSKSGLMKKLHILSENEIADPSIFNPQNFPLCLFINGEFYIHTVKNIADGKNAIINYVKNGGFLLLLPNQPYPMYYPVIKGSKSFNPEPLLPQIGMGLNINFENPPPNTKMNIKKISNNIISNDIPPSLPFPQSGDLRLRTFNPATKKEGGKYQSLFVVEGLDDGGKITLFGDAGEYVEFTSGEFKGGEILYIWFRILDSNDYSIEIIKDVIEYAIYKKLWI